MSRVLRLPKSEPIPIGCYTLTSTGIDVVGDPSFREHERVGEFIRSAHQASGWWLADWLAYGQTRRDWVQKLEQVIDATGYAHGTVKNIKYLGENVTKLHRRDDVDISLHFEVASLAQPEQDEWLEKAALEGWSRSEMRKAIRASKRSRIVEGQAALEGMFRVLYADPPYEFRDSATTPDGSLGKLDRHYLGMKIEDICALPVESHALPDSVLLEWTPPSMIPEALAIGAAWGFTYKTNLTWDKVLGNWGPYVRIHHEHLLIFTRGSCLPDNPTPMPDSVQTVRRQGEHSEKPQEFRALIQQLWTRGPYLELFGRKPCEGWSVFGNDARLWADEMAEAI